MIKIFYVHLFLLLINKNKLKKKIYLSVFIYLSDNLTNFSKGSFEI